MNHLVYRIRRTLLRTLVPEFVWPRHVTIDGARVRVRNAPYSFGVKRVLARGEYEVDERRLLASLVAPGDVVIEMGGSIGVLTAVIAQRVGPAGCVVSVEGSQELTRYSRTWLETLGNVRVVTGFAFPVWRLERRVAIERFEEKWGSMSGRLTFQVTDEQGADAASNGGAPLFDVETLAGMAGRPPVTLVVDIEGSEQIVASQPPRFPASLRNLLIELHPHMYGEDVQAAIIRRIEDEGFAREAQEGTVYLFRRPARA